MKFLNKYLFDSRNTELFLFGNIFSRPVYAYHFGISIKHADRVFKTFLDSGVLDKIQNGLYSFSSDYIRYVIVPELKRKNIKNCDSLIRKVPLVNKFNFEKAVYLTLKITYFNKKSILIPPREYEYFQFFTSKPIGSGYFNKKIFSFSKNLFLLTNIDLDSPAFVYIDTNQSKKTIKSFITKLIDIQEYRAQKLFIFSYNPIETVKSRFQIKEVEKENRIWIKTVYNSSTHSFDKKLQDNNKLIKKDVKNARFYKDMFLNMDLKIVSVSNYQNHLFNFPEKILDIEKTEIEEYL